MSARGVEEVLARLFCDEDFRMRFLQNADAAIQEYPLDNEERKSLCSLDTTGLGFASASFERKRAGRKRSGFS